MPELPEVESVRRGLADLVTGRTVVDVRVLHWRLLRDQEGGVPAFAGRLTGRTLTTPARRGKFLWLPLLADASSVSSSGSSADPDEALAVHLGMSGQVRVTPPDDPVHPHTRVIARLDDGRDLRFVDQRMFGRLRVDDLVTGPGGLRVPAHAAHIAQDPLEPGYDDRALVRRLRSKRTAIKRALLDQTLLSGVGNIYADESLWRAGLHGDRATATLPAATGLRLMAHVRDVLTEAVRAGGTSFDALYVNVNGESGWFGTDLAVYGREGLPCPRCGRPIVRSSFANRSSFTCPQCQPLGRRRSSAAAGGRSVTVTDHE
jgi:formamidopyrimidine-DNA glycosylase